MWPRAKRARALPICPGRWVPELRQALSLEGVWALNDLAAIAQAVSFLVRADWQVLNVGMAVRGICTMASTVPDMTYVP